MSGDATIRAGSPDVDAIRLSARDNVATVLRPIAPGERLRVRCGGEVSTAIAREAIPLCHKVSLADIPAGTKVVKYGSAIGDASTAIQAGAHVHVHNMRSARARRLD